MCRVCRKIDIFCRYRSGIKRGDNFFRYQEKNCKKIAIFGIWTIWNISVILARGAYLKQDKKKEF